MVVLDLVEAEACVSSLVTAVEAVFWDESSARSAFLDGSKWFS